MRNNLKTAYKNFAQTQLSIIAIEGECSFVKLTLKEYLTLMSFVYKDSKGKGYKIADLLNLYLLIKSNISKNLSLKNKFGNFYNKDCMYLDKIVKASNLSQTTVKKYLDALCYCNLIKKCKKETKVYYILNSDFNKTLKEKEENE